VRTYDKAASRTAANPYAPVDNPYVPDPPIQPGTPDDALDGPPGTNPLNAVQPPVTTRPRVRPDGGPTDYGQPATTSAPTPGVAPAPAAPEPTETTGVRR